MAQDSTFGAISKMGELKSRLLFLLGALVIFRLGAHIPVPGIDGAAWMLDTENYMPRLRADYDDRIKAAMIEEFGYKAMAKLRMLVNTAKRTGASVRGPIPLPNKIEKFTVGKDRFYDLFIAKYDIKATIAHAKMLHSIKVLTHSELDKIISELNLINNDIKIGKFIIEDNYEDVHSKIESILVKKLGIIGKERAIACESIVAINKYE